MAATDVHIALRDGSTARVRPVVPGDAPALRDFLAGLSENSRWLRYFTLGVDLDAAAQRAAAGDRPEGYGLIVTTGADDRVVAHAVFEVERPERAEIAFAVADEMQGRGLATVLLAHLAQIASARGIEEFTATVLPENRRMISVFRESGFRVRVHASPDGIEVEFPTELGDDALVRFEDRDRVAAVAAVERIVRPRSVAVVGASRRPDSFGGLTFAHALAAGFRGELYPVNPNVDFIGSRQASPSVLETPGHVDLAIVAVPAETVPSVAHDCAQAGVAGLVVITAGFAEAGAEGEARLAALLDACRAGGMRLVGPNCMGVVNTDPEVRLSATFARADVPAGTVGFASQSGAFGAAAIDGVTRRGIGLSTFVSFGDKADLSSNDWLQYWEQDRATSVVALYLESFGNPRKFGRVARRVARAKPVLAIKAGRTSPGARRASSHTGALLAATDTAVDALFASAGVIRCDGLDDLLDAAALLAEQPLPRGGRVGIVANARGPAVVCGDACADAGLEVVCSVQLGTTETLERFRAAVEAVDADAVIAIFVEHIRADAEEAAEALAATRLDAPLLAVFMTPGPLPEVLRGAAKIPAFAAPEAAARALGRAVAYVRWRESAPPEPAPLEDVDPDTAAAVLARALAHGGGWLGPEDVEALLRAYGVWFIDQRRADSPAAAARAAAGLGGTVALKAVVPDLIHKARAGAVRLHLHGQGAIRRAANELHERFGDLDGYVVQRMAEPGVEMLVGVLADERFGPVVACAAGGEAVQEIADVQVRLAPIAPEQAIEMIGGLRTAALLQRAGADIDALADMIVRVAALADAHPAIAELDCNPVIASPRGALAVDARVRVAPPAVQPPFPALGR
ncbi:bifunctional acetate--CoA ligase family protein/GNAT family N-acetyltransferase [Candidatus Solirubrobacter pratensis]|uniref:bifunctional acetate--CoA ligase family protein/GNAT family N-acetyltransferase n=1 Tax=Candidatus Solirubrobacter pratensis TaxID=1298857 RepID=UPI0003F9A6B1|nr:bifunctional GNAT family N-acetyltransferase/acetate--CoA ligase family protein [Candidatus Solirubrobacter pratensis]